MVRETSIRTFALRHHIKMTKLLKILSKTVLNRLWSCKKPTFKNRIIYYHSVSDEFERSHSSFAFEEQMRWLKSNGFCGMTVSSLAQENVQLDLKKIGISFDDGYADNLEIAVPILLSMGFKATFFVATDYIGAKDRIDSSTGFRLYKGHQMLNRNDLRKLVEAGMEVGSHGISHQMLTQIPFNAAIEEISRSKHALEKWLGTRVKAIAFPNGQRGAFSDKIVGACFDVGYETVCSTLWGCYDDRNSERWLPRCEISSLDDLAEFPAKILGHRDYRFYIDRTIDKSRVWSNDKFN